MSAVPLIEAVQRAGGAIILRGDRLRLSAPEPLPENLLEELRAHKAELIDHLQHARPPKLAQPATGALTHCTIPSAEIASWVAGVARLATMAPPRTYPAHAWQQLIVDAERFLDDWAHRRRRSAGRRGNCSAAIVARPGAGSRAWGWCSCCTATRSPP